MWPQRDVTYRLPESLSTPPHRSGPIETLASEIPEDPSTFNGLHDTLPETNTTPGTSSSSTRTRSPDSGTSDCDGDLSSDASTSPSTSSWGSDAASDQSSETEYDSDASSVDGMPGLISASDSEDEGQYGIRLVQTTPEDFEIEFQVFDDDFWNVEGRVYEVGESVSYDSNGESSDRANGSTIGDLNTADGGKVFVLFILRPSNANRAWHHGSGQRGPGRDSPGWDR